MVLGIKYQVPGAGLRIVIFSTSPPLNASQLPTHNS